MSSFESLNPQYAAAVLEWYLANGVDEALADKAQDRLAPRMVPQVAGVAVAPESVASATATQAQPVRAGPGSMANAGAAEISKAEAVALAKSAQNLDDLKAAIAAFEGLAIKRTAMNLVFGEGNPQARVMIIGDVPESEEDRAGKPFVGEQGMLLDKMFAAIGLSRGAEVPEQAIYVTQLLNWRPPGNRSPTQAEIDISLPFLERHVALVNPKAVVVMGQLATKVLMTGTTAKLRGAMQVYKLRMIEAGIEDVPALVTHAPSVLLKAPLKKREAWEDLQILAKTLAAL